jgi:RNA polymerase sigma-70 factor, ECF subfamily
MQVSDDIRHQIVALLPRLRRFAYALTGDSDRGDDLVQDTCVRALSKQEQWQVGTRLDSWLYRIAQNLWFDRIRAGKVRGDNVDIDSVENLPGDDGRSITESRSTLNVVAGAIDRLLPDQRILIVLVCVDGLTYKEAADVLEIPIGTVMSRLARARRALHEATQSEPARDMSVEVGSRRG